MLLFQWTFQQLDCTVSSPKQTKPKRRYFLLAANIQLIFSSSGAKWDSEETKQNDSNNKNDIDNNYRCDTVAIENLKMK